MIRFPWRRDDSVAGSATRHTDGSPHGERPGSPRDESGVTPGIPREGSVRGECAPSVVSARSLQSRMSSLLAGGLMISVGAGMLAWYYAETLSRPAAARGPAHASMPENVGQGMILPSFAPVMPPPVAHPAPLAPSAGAVPTLTPSRSPITGPSSAVPALPLGTLLEPLARAPGGLPGGYGVPSVTTPRQRVLDRRLSGEVFAGGRSGSSASVAAVGVSEAPAAISVVPDAQAQMPASDRNGDALEALLRPSVLSATRAQILPTLRLLLPKGTSIDCTLETAIDSTLPGMTTCVTATDTFGADGTVVLLERGTKLIGETRGQVHQGDTRVFVVWTEARTPRGVVVQLDSPATDALGRSGLAGKVNRHFWQRFGAAALVSMIDGAVQYEAQSSSRGGAVVLDPTASEDVLTDILRSTVSIPPTILVRNGARIQVLVARDIDFRPVYELESR